jgi:hypothetical protein
MREIVSDPNLVARCGLYCGACIDEIRRLGVQGHADEMTKRKRQTIRR